MVLIWLGNHRAVDHVGEPARVRVALDGKRCTTIHTVASGSELATDLTALWAHLSDAPTPAWTATHDPGAAAVLAALWPGVEVRQPDPEA